MTKEQDQRRVPAGQDTSSWDKLLAFGRANADKRARAYLSERSVRRAEFEEAKEFLKSGDLTPKAFSVIEQNLERFELRPENEPALRKALRRIMAEEKPASTEAQKAPEEKIKLPKDRKFSPKEKELLLALSQADMTGEEVDKKFYRGISRKVRSKRRHKLIDRTKRKLRGTELKIINLTPHGSNKGAIFHLERPREAVQVPEVIVAKPEKEKIVKGPKGEVIELPDGQRFEVFRKQQKGAAESLFKTSIENPVSIVELAKLLYGEETPEALEKTANVVSRIRLKLQKQGWTIRNLTTTPEQLKGQKSRYYLVRTGQVTEKPAPEVKEKLGEKITPKKEEKEISKEGKLYPKEKRLFDILQESDRPLGAEELAKILSPELSDKEARQTLARTAYSLKKKLVGSGKELVGPGKGKIGGDYYLREEGSGEVKESSLAMHLPDGQGVIIVGDKQRMLLERLISTSIEQSVSATELKKLLDRERVDAPIKDLRDKLNKLGWTIINKTTLRDYKKGLEAQYYLLKQEVREPVQKEVDKTEPVEHMVFERQEAFARTSDAILEAPVVREIPYVPSEEEKRSEEETKILGALVSQLSSKGKLYFTDLQIELEAEKRERTAPGYKKGEEVEFRVYEGKELKEKFLSALGKIREEFEIPSLRNAWSGEDQKLWKDLQAAINRFSGGDAENFVRRLRLEIDRAERKFHADYKSGENWTGWIRKKRIN